MTKIRLHSAQWGSIPKKHSQSRMKHIVKWCWDLGRAAESHRQREVPEEMDEGERKTLRGGKQRIVLVSPRVAGE
jgi:hypothetical protein